jgi:hypothetical protein
MSESTIPITVNALICHRDVNQALICLGSLLKFSAQPLHMLIHDDGSLTPEDIEKLLDGLKGPTIISRPEADTQMEELLKNHPNCYKYRREHVYGLKLLDVALLSPSDFAYCDSDILFFRPFDGLFRFPHPDISAIFMRDYAEAYSMLPWALLGINKPKLASKVNAGLIFFRKSAYDLDFLDWFLGQEQFRYKVNWLEQTSWAALGHRAGCHQWNTEQIVLIRPWSYLTDRLVAGHFVGEVRHRLNEFHVLSEQTLDAGEPISVETFSPPDCNLLELGQVHAVKQLKRLRNYHKITNLLRQKLLNT